MRSRDLAFAVLMGGIVTCVVAIGSAALGLSVIWPGAILGGVMAACSTYLGATGGRR